MGLTPQLQAWLAAFDAAFGGPSTTAQDPVLLASAKLAELRRRIELFASDPALNATPDQIGAVTAEYAALRANAVAAANALP